MRQPEQLGLGHAVLCAERVVGDEPFAVLLADDFIISEGKGVTTELVRSYMASGRSQLSVMRVSDEAISSYGVVVPGDAAGSVVGLVEKPKFAEAPSDLVSIGRYVLTPDIFDVLRGQRVDAGGELQLAEGLDSKGRHGTVEVVMLEGRRYDCGSVAGYLEAIGAEVEARGQVQWPHNVDGWRPGLRSQVM